MGTVGEAAELMEVCFPDCTVPTLTTSATVNPLFELLVLPTTVLIDDDDTLARPWLLSFEDAGAIVYCTMFSRDVSAMRIYAGCRLGGRKTRTRTRLRKLKMGLKRHERMYPKGSVYMPDGHDGDESVKVS